MPDIRYAMVPKGDYQILDDWDVMGLCGTGSKSVVIDDKFVPNHRIVSHKEMSDATSPGSRLHADPVYHAPIWSFVPFTISAPACGIAQGALESRTPKPATTVRAGEHYLIHLSSQENPACGTRSPPPPPMQPPPYEKIIGGGFVLITVIAVIKAWESPDSP